MDEKELQKKLEGYFTWFHSHPETAMEEFETTFHIKHLLAENGISVLDNNMKTGVLAEIHGKKDKPVIALRCDIDALPIEEAADVSYRSKNPGKMHACGHDFHTTALIGAALLLKEQEKELEGTVKLLFQPAEEASHGAEQVLKTGVLNDVEEIYGLHVQAGLKPGAISVVASADHAAVDRFTINIKGTGCHAAHPDTGTDPIVTAAQLINILQTIVSRNISAFDRAVVSVTRLETGTTWNVIPSSAQIEGTVRTLNKDIRQKIINRIKEICDGTAIASGTKIQFNWYPGCPSTNNDAKLVEFVKDIAKGLGLETQEAVPSMGGEDFSCYQEKIRGAFWSIGVGSDAPLHNPFFKADKSVLSTAAKILAAVGKNRLKQIDAKRHLTK